MCKYCEVGDGVLAEPIKNDSSGMVLLAKDVHNEGKILIQVIEIWKGLFNRPKYAHRFLDFNVNFCPMCGRNLNEVTQGTDKQEKDLPAVEYENDDRLADSCSVIGIDCRILEQLSQDLRLSIEGKCHDGRERSLALTKLDECVMWAKRSLVGKGYKKFL